MNTALYRGAVDDLRLVRGDYVDGRGRLRSRVVRGAGVALFFHENGLCSLLQVYFDGRLFGPACMWSESGVLVRHDAGQAPPQ